MSLKVSTSGIKTLQAGTGISIDATNPKSPIISNSADLSGFVPYTGATANVDLGAFALTAATVNGLLATDDISQFTNDAGYITSFTETDTLASVTARGATTAVQSTFSGGLLLNAGTAALPSYSFSGDLNTGMWSPAADTIAMSVGGVQTATLTATGLGIGVTNPLARIHGISTSEQLRLGFDGSNYWRANTGATGITTLGLVGSGSHFRIASPSLNIEALKVSQPITQSITDFVATSLSLDHVGGSAFGSTARWELSRTATGETPNGLLSLRMYRNVADSAIAYDSGVTAFTVNQAGGVNFTAGVAFVNGVSEFKAIAPIFNTVFGDATLETPLAIQRPLSGGKKFPSTVAFKIGTYDTTTYSSRTQLQIWMSTGDSTGFTTDTSVMTLNGNGNIGFTTTDQFGSGVRVLGIANASVVPTTNPSGGGVLYVEAGALKYKGSSGTVTTIAAA